MLQLSLPDLYVFAMHLMYPWLFWKMFLVFYLEVVRNGMELYAMEQNCFMLLRKLLSLKLQ